MTMLTPADGAKCDGLIERLPDAMWRASTRVTLDTRSEETGPETFGSEEAAREWVSEVARKRGFTVVHIGYKLLAD